MKAFKANFILGKKQIILASLVLVLGVAVYLNWQFANTGEDLSLTNTMDVDQTPTALDPLVVDETANTITGEDAMILDTTLKGEDASAELDKDGNAKLTAKNTDTDTNTVIPQEVVKDETKIANTETDVIKEDTETAKSKNLGDALLVTSKSIADETYFAMAKLARTKSRDEVIDTISTILSDEKLTDEDKKAVSAKAITVTDIIETESRIENLIKAKGFSECVVYITDKAANVVVKSDGLDQDKATQIKNIIVSEGKIAGENVSITEIAG